MRILGGLSLDDNSWELCFVSLQRRKILPYTVISGESYHNFNNLKEFITNSIDYINERISYTEKNSSFKTESIFFRLPRECAGKKEAEDVISLNVGKKVKKITYKDIDYAKRQIENISLGLKDICIHHLVSEYKIGDKTFSRPPIGLWARKMHIKSIMIFVPSDIYDVFIDSFSNVERKFSGFVYGALADYSAAYNNIIEKPVFVVNIRKNSTIISYFYKGSIIFEKNFCCGSKSIISYVAKRLSFSEELASDLIFKYSSFYDVDLSKEISVKEQNEYINVSLATLNNLIKEAVADHISAMMPYIKRESLSDDYAVLFMGKITQKDGFHNFVKKHFNINVTLPLYNKLPSCAFGCVRYGIKRLFEKEEAKGSLWQRIAMFYKDYF